MADARRLDVALDVAVTADVEKVPDAPPPDYVRPPEITRTASDEERATQRQACTFGPGAWPAETVGREVPIGDQMPIDHIIVVMQENRSFDHYFRKLPQAGQTDVDVAADDWSNPDARGMPVRFHHDTERCIEDVAHGWNPVHRQFNNGAMDGFVVTNDPNGDRGMTYFDQTDIPFYYALANTFAIGDRYFSSLLGPTAPNRLYLMAGTSFGLAHNNLVAQDLRDSPVNHVFRSLDAAGVTWKDYAGGARMVGFFPYYGIIRRQTRAHYASIDDLHRDLAAGTLPAVSFVEPNYLGDGGERVDEHPPGIPMQGERWVERIVRSLMASPLWSRSALFVVYDEHGGFADHVAPPAACEPDALTPAAEHRPGRGALRPLRRARALHGGLALRAAALRVAPHLRPRVHPALHRGALRAPRAHPPRRQRAAPDGPLRLREPALHDPADAPRRGAPSTPPCARAARRTFPSSWAR